MYIARARCENQLTVGSSGLNARWSQGRAVEFKFLAWSSVAQSVCQREFSLLAIWCLGLQVQSLYSAEEHNLSPFNLNIACLCQSIEINNNKHVYRQSQMRKSTDSGVKWAECSQIIGTGCRVQVLSLILDSSVGLPASIQSDGD